jgi:hypothetical protein
VFKEWRLLAVGTHGSVRRARIQNNDFDGFVCVKLFTEEWKEAYEREVNAYELMYHRGVTGCVPRVYWKGALPESRWNGGIESDSDDGVILYGLVMEFFDDCREVDFSKIGVTTAEAIGRALKRIHDGRVAHSDIAERNVLLVRQAGKIRVVWIDFSCAWVGASDTVLDNDWAGLAFYIHRALVQHS